ncbi:MAG TPA: serine protease [Mucilaginibacter sp.]|jgi:hypothetical protein|nr:serine protease [Mucilaginibacter sp.]
MRHLLFLLLLPTCHLAIAQKLVDPLSSTSLKIELYNNQAHLGSATGFIIEKNNKYYLVTNLHVFTGTDYYSHAIMDSLHRIPTTIGIWHNTKILGNWLLIPERLYYTNKTKRWIECNYQTNTIDLAALPLEHIPDTVKLNFFDLSKNNNDVLVSPGSPALIIGFPYGLSSAGRFAIWKTGHIASDIDIDADELPVFMIDATTRPGMSGSLVFVRLSNYQDKKGTVHLGGTITSFIGVYSSQSNLEEIGYVWKPAALQALIDKLP